jgi:hypothetical protein
MRRWLVIVTSVVLAGPVADAAFTAPAATWSAAAAFPTVPQAVLADAPLAYYRLDDAPGSVTLADVLADRAFRHGARLRRRGSH